METALFKSGNTLALRRLDSPGYLLHNLDCDKIEILDNNEMECWSRWENVFSLEKLDALISNRFVIRKTWQHGAPFDEFDPVIPCVDDVFVKWYFESSELAVLFCTRQMTENNPLLVLNSYGSLCWKGILENRTISEIRRNALRVFGVDEVVLFLKRLERLGFIKPLPDIYGNFREVVIKEVPAPAIQFRLSHSKIPWYCLWEVNMKCNYRCKVCYLPHFKSSGPDLNKAIDVAQQIIDSGIFYVCLLGGEPLLRGDLEIIVRKLRSAGVFVKIITNGHYLVKSRAEKLVDSGINQIEISFDGLSESTHDISRGAGSLAHAMKAVSNAVQAKAPRIAIVLTMHSGNLHEIDHLPDFLFRLGVRECYISLFKKTGLNGSQAPYEPLTHLEIDEINEKILNFNSNWPQLNITLLPACSCGHTSLVIGDNGDVRFCSFSYYSVGNLYETPLMKLWNPQFEKDLDDLAWGYCQSNNKSTLSPLLPSATP